MPRFIDELRSPKTKIAMPPFVAPERAEFWAQTAHDIRHILCTYDMPVVVVDDVAEYFHMSVENGKLDWNWEVFTNLAPPYHLFWCEYHTSKGWVGSLFMDDVARAGLLSKEVNQRLDKGRGPDCRWILNCYLFADDGHGPEGPHVTSLFVRANGQIIKIWQSITFANPVATELDDYWEQDFFKGLREPILLAICFMHCKDIVIKDNTVDPPLAKKYRAQHGVAPTNYKILIIEPLKSILRHKGRSGEVGLMKAIHICRGHWSDYRPGNGLFGKLHKEVWIPDRIRCTQGKAPKAPKIEVRPPKPGF